MISRTRVCSFRRSRRPRTRSAIWANIQLKHLPFGFALLYLRGIDPAKVKIQIDLPDFDALPDINQQFKK